MPERPAGSTFARRVLPVLAAAALGSCGGPATELSTTSAAGITGTWVGTLGTTGSCGSGSVTATITQGGLNLFGTWSTSGFSAAPPCDQSTGAGTAAGALVGDAVFLTLTKGG